MFVPQGSDGLRVVCCSAVPIVCVCVCVMIVCVSASVGVENNKCFRAAIIPLPAIALTRSPRWGGAGKRVSHRRSSQGNPCRTSGRTAPGARRRAFLLLIHAFLFLSPATARSVCWHRACSFGDLKSCVARDCLRLRLLLPFGSVPFLRRSHVRSAFVCNYVNPKTKKVCGHKFTGQAGLDSHARTHSPARERLEEVQQATGEQVRCLSDSSPSFVVVVSLARSLTHPGIHTGRDDGRRRRRPACPPH